MGPSTIAPLSRSYFEPCQGQTRQPSLSSEPFDRSASWWRQRDETALACPPRFATVHWPGAADGAGRQGASGTDGGRVGAEPPGQGTGAARPTPGGAPHRHGTMHRWTPRTCTASAGGVHGRARRRGQAAARRGRQGRRAELKALRRPTVAAYAGEPRWSTPSRSCSSSCWSSAGRSPRPRPSGGRARCAPSASSGGRSSRRWPPPRSRPAGAA